MCDEIYTLTSGHHMRDCLEHKRQQLAVHTVCTEHSTMMQDHQSCRAGIVLNKH